MPENADMAENGRMGMAGGENVMMIDDADGIAGCLRTELPDGENVFGGMPNAECGIVVRECRMRGM